MAAPTSILESLTDEQKDQLYDWLTEMPVPDVVEKLALPAPEGFGIKTHNTTLQRFKRRRFVEQTADQIEAAAALSGATAGHEDTLDNGIAAGLKRHLFQRASAPDATDAQVALLARWVHRNEKLKLDVQRVQMSREKFAHKKEMDAFRKQIAEQRLELEKRRLALAEKKATANASNPNADHLGPYATNWDDVSERLRMPGTLNT
jgi:hypothetical protein